MFLIFYIICFLLLVKIEAYVNPIIAKGADPWVIKHQNYYYYCFSTGDSIVVSKSKNLQDIGIGDKTTVFIPPPNQPYSKEIWAPELHYINGMWYIYFAADDGDNNNHRMYVLESINPTGNFNIKGKIAPQTDKWSIDGTVLQKPDNSLYFIWSGWAGDQNYQQNLYIAEMENPWTIKGERVLISSPSEPWEMKSQPYVPGGINEGPEIFLTPHKIYIIYSASGSWSDNYCLGWLVCDSGDVMNPLAWKKSGPVFSSAEQAYGPGHASFTLSLDEKENWIVYHACVDSGSGWNGRSIRIQKFDIFNERPSFGRPAPCYEQLPDPSGSV